MLPRLALGDQASTLRHNAVLYAGQYTRPFEATLRRCVTALTDDKPTTVT